jgi:autotransporter-associated beta strand protein
MFNFVDRATYDFSGLTLASSPITYSSSAVQGSFSSGVLSITTANNLGGDGFSVRLLGNYTSASSFSISLTSGSQDSVGFGIATLTSQLPSTPNPVTIRPINANNDVTSGLGTVTSRVFDGGTLILAANNADAFTITNLGGAMNVATGAVTASGVISNEGLNAGMLKKTGAGRLVLSAANTYSGGTTVEAGTLQISTMENLGSGAVMLNGGTLAVTETIATSRAMSVGVANGTLDVASGKALTVSGEVSGSGALNKTSAGSLILSGTNTHTGTVGVNQGTLVLNGSTASSVMTVSAGAVLTGSGSTAGAVEAEGGGAPATNSVGEGVGAHDAGYDAFMTGVVFARVAARLCAVRADAAAGAADHIGAGDGTAGRQAVEAPDGGGDLACGGITLDDTGPDDDPAGPAFADAVQDVADDGAGGAGDDADHGWEGGNGCLAAGLEQTLAGQFRLQPLQLGQQGPGAGSLHGLDDDLVG